MIDALVLTEVQSNLAYVDVQLRKDLDVGTSILGRRDMELADEWRL